MNAPFAHPISSGLPQVLAERAAYEAALLATVDETDEPMLLVGFAGVVLHANETARIELLGGHPLRCVGHQLRACNARDGAALDNALIAALARGEHTLLAMGADAPLAVGVIGLTLADAGERRVALVTMERRPPGARLTLVSTAGETR